MPYDETEGIEEPLAEEQQGAEPEGPREPADLAEAMQMLRASNAEPAEKPVEEGPEVDGDTDEPDDSGDAEPEPEHDAGQAADGGPEYDYRAAQDDLKLRANQLARQMAADEFKKNGVRRLNINDLYELDKGTGRASFRNPDDPNRPFSSRQEAQMWIDSYNSQYEAAFKSTVDGYRGELVKTVAPTARMLAFAPKADAMDEDTLAIFDELIQPYEIKDRQGRVRGYRCDLDAAHTQAVRIVERMKGKASQANTSKAVETAQKAVEASAGPALDAKAHGSSADADGNREPSNLQEAMRMYQEQRKKGRK